MTEQQPEWFDDHPQVTGGQKPKKRRMPESIVVLYLLVLLVLSFMMLGTHLLSEWFGGEGLPVVKADGYWFANLNAVALVVGFGQRSEKRDPGVTSPGI